MDWLTDIPALLSSHSAPGQLAHRLTKARLDLPQRKDRRACYSRRFLMLIITRDEIVRACLAEMRAKLESATPATRMDADAAILLYSGIIKTFTAEPSLPIAE